MDRNPIIIGTICSACYGLPKLSELEQIRTALGLSQEQMGKALGVGTQSAYQAWEANPDKPAGRKALEAAKALYKDRTKKEWGAGPATAPQEAPAPGITPESFHREIGKLEGRLERLERAFENLAEGVRELAIRDEEKRKREATGVISEPSAN